MQFMPLNFLIIWLFGLLSIGLLGGGVYIIYEWYERELVGLSYLLGGSAMVLWSLPVALSACRDCGAQELMNPSPCAQGTAPEPTGWERPASGVLWS
jgi:hypothetical protein